MKNQHHNENEQKHVPLFTGHWTRDTSVSLAETIVETAEVLWSALRRLFLGHL